MSEELFQPRSAAPSAEADRAPGADQPTPQSGQSAPESVANAPTLPLPTKRSAPPVPSDEPEAGEGGGNGGEPGDGGGGNGSASGGKSRGESGEQEQPGSRARHYPGGRRAQQRIEPSVPLAQLRRALDSFYATHANETEADSGAAPSVPSQKAKPSSLPARKKGASAQRGRPSPAQTSIPSPRVGESSTAGSGSIAQRPLSSPTARPTPSEPLAGQGNPAKAEKSEKPEKPAKAAKSARPAPEIAPVAETKTGIAAETGIGTEAVEPTQPVHPTRSPHPGRRRAIRLKTRPSLRWWLIAGVLALILAGSAAVLGANLSGNKSAAPPAPTAPPPAPADGVAVSAAVTWIIHNVGTEHVVACDVTVCGLLRTQGFPATLLITVRDGISDVEQADVVVDTALLRQLAGPRLTSVEASQPLAVFGVNAQLTVVQTVALVGPTQYGQQLSADLASRIQAGAALLANPRLTLSPIAQTQLAQGMVDSRICSLLALLLGGHSITVASFLAPGPGAGPDIPSAGLVISVIDGQPADGTSVSAAALRSLLAAQQSPYEPLSVGPASAVAAAGQPPLGALPTATPPAGALPTGAVPTNVAATALPPAGSGPTGASGTGGESSGGGLEILYAQPGPLGLLGGGIQ